MTSYASLIDQEYYIVPSFELECGTVLKNAPVAYKTWGVLNDIKDNVMIICHAFTGSADVEDWWGPLMGRGKAFDPYRFFIICLNTLGSPYGSASPVTINPDTGKPYGPEFPPTTIRDDVRIHKLVLDHLGVTSVAVVIGGSMGGMAVLEWPLCSPPGYIRHVIPLATSARHSAWCISWGEAQRQSIYSDPGYQDGYYEAQPASGLAAARMAALLTYRSRDSFESRFGRKAQGTGPKQDAAKKLITPPESPRLVASTPDLALAVHNDGHRNAKSRLPNIESTIPPAPSPNGTVSSSSSTSSSSLPSPSSTTTPSPSIPAPQQPLPSSCSPSSPINSTTPTSKPPIFSAQSYLRYQGDKFTARFDANCYIHITRKLDTHDITRGRVPLPSSSSSSSIPTPPPPRFLLPTDGPPTDPHLAHILTLIPPHALVISIASDGLFTPYEQKQLASYIPHAELEVIPSLDGHDGFLLEFERINGYVLAFLRRVLGEVYQGEEMLVGGDEEVKQEGDGKGDFEIKKTSVFGEAEVDVAQW